MRDRQTDVFTQGIFPTSGDKVVAAVYGNQNLKGSACADSGGDCGGNLPEQGICKDDAHRADDDIRIGCVYQYGVLS